jgi:hypothetical protein
VPDQWRDRCTDKLVTSAEALKAILRSGEKIFVRPILAH